MNKREKLKKLLARIAELSAKAQDNGWTDEEREEFDKADKEATELKAEIEEEDKQKAADANRLRRAQELQTTATQGNRRTSAGANFNADENHGGGDRGGDTRWVRDGFQADPMRGFRSHVDFFEQVRNAASGGEISQNLRSMAAGSDEQGSHSDPDGGFLVPTALVENVMQTGTENDPTVGLVTDVPMETPLIEIPYRVDKNHSTSVSGGLQVQWGTETQDTDPSKLKLGKMQFKANELMGLSFTTRQLLERSFTSVVALLRAGFQTEFMSKIFQAKLYGDGVGKPLGVMSSPCKIAVAAEGGQGADTILGNNLVNMMSRQWRYGSSIWIANHNCLPQLVKAHITMTNSDGPIFLPPNAQGTPNTLLGRPIFFTEHAKSLGDEGDIMNVVWSEYLFGEYMPMREESSIHVRFVNHESAFKFWQELAGMPWWDAPLTPVNGSTLSPVVSLAAR